MSQDLVSTAVIYARVSSREQEKEGYSIDAQLKLLRRYAVEHGLAVKHEYVDIETAKRAGRTNFNAMLKFLRKSRSSCRIVLVEKTDRLYRNIKDWVTVDELDLELHLVKEGEVVSRNSRSSEKFVHGIKVLMARQYTDNLGEEASKGLAEKAAQGIYPSNAPLGYRNVQRDDGRRVIEPDPETAPAIRRLYEDYATGEFSLRDITHKAAEYGLVFRRSRSKVPRSSVERILKNRIYTGDFEWKGEVYHGIHEPLVSQGLWDQVQKVFAERYGTRPGSGRHRFAFSKLITCGHCGCLLVGERKKQRYVYYHCTGYRGKCPEKYVREEVLEEKFGELLDRLHFDEEVLDWVSRALRESHADEKQHHQDALERLQKRYLTLQRRLDTMYEDRLDGRISGEEFDKRAAEQRSEQARVQRLIAEHQAANQTYFDEGIQLLDLARRARELFAAQEAGEKRRLLGFLLSNCSWRDGELQAEFKQPFDILAESAQAHKREEAARGCPDGLYENWRG